MSRGNRTAPRFLQAVRQRDVGGSKRRCQREQDRTAAGENRREQDHSQVQAGEFRCSRRIGQRRHQRSGNPLRREDAERAAAKREQQTFGEKLTDHAAARCADRDANGQLAHPRPAAREQEIRHVGARHEHHDRHDDGHDAQRFAHGVPTLRLTAGSRQHLKVGQSFAASAGFADATVCFSTVSSRPCRSVALTPEASRPIIRTHQLFGSSEGSSPRMRRPRMDNGT